MQERAFVQKMQGAQPPVILRRVDAVPVALPLKKPMKMAGVTITHADNLLVRIEAADGLVGWGEAASAPSMTGDTLGGLVAAVRDHLAPMMIGQDAGRHSVLIKGLRRALVGNTGAHSAVEMALLDLAGRAAGLSLIDLVGSAKRRTVAPMWLLGNATPEQDIKEARAKQQEGFCFFKVKIGTKQLQEEIAGTLALREALGPDVPLCADANGGLSLEDALGYVQHTKAAGLLFLEQPLDPHDFDRLTELARMSPISIGADEGIHSLTDIETHARCGVHGLSLKLIKLGGIGTALEAAALSARLGLSLNIAAKIAESSIASAAAVHLACAAPSADWGVSLTHFYLAEDLVLTPPPLRDGHVTLPVAPGLGVDVDEAAVERMRVNR